MLSAFIVLFFVINVLLTTALAVVGSWLALIALAGALSSGYVIFKDSMNLVQGVGRLYWIIRDNGSKGIPFVAPGFMIEVNHPWRVGNGIQFRLHRWTFQMGWCRPNPDKEETEGMLDAVGGRYMEEAPEEIGVWR